MKYVYYTLTDNIHFKFKLVMDLHGSIFQSLNLTYTLPKNQIFWYSFTVILSAND